MTPLPPRKGADAFALQAMLLLCLIWGVQQVAVKLAAGDIAPIMQAFARNLLAATLVGLLVLWRGDWKAAGGTLAGLPEEDLAELPDLGGAVNEGIAWRHEPARLSAAG